MASISSPQGSSIRMGEMAIQRGPGQLQTLLGSCLGVVLYDRRLRFGGLAHIVLPSSRGKREHPGKYVDTAIPALIHAMTDHIGEPVRLTAKLAGGARMFATTQTLQIGQENLQACETVLKMLGISILARHCGGEHGRRMTLNVATGEVSIEIVGQSPVII